MRTFMGILSVFASLFGVSCSKQTVHVEFVSAKDKSVIAVSDMSPDQLPESFAINTTMDLMNRKWAVETAEPIEKSQFMKTGKLRVVLSPVTMMSPQDVLFSLATISDDIGTVAGDALPSEKILALHEDDWRQMEFVSQSFAREVDQELSEIQRIYKDQRDGVGFKKVHVRKRIPNPLRDRPIRLPELEAILRPQRKFEAVGFQRTRGTIPLSFAWNLDQALMLWGVTDSSGNITYLCVVGFPESSNVVRLSGAFSSLTTQYKLVFVDWCRAASVSSDAQAFASYFGQKR